MTEVPDRGGFETTNDWLEAVAEETGADLGVLESVVGKVRPELMSLPDSEKMMQLQRLLDAHIEFMTDVEGDAEAWVDVYFERDGEVDNYYQYLMMTHNLARVKEEEVERFREVAEDEDMELEDYEGENFTMAHQYDWEGVEDELRLVLRILDDVYGVGVEDIVRAEEQREGEVIPWTDA